MLFVCFSVADADVITTLIALGILEPSVAAKDAPKDGDGVEDAPEEPAPAAGASTGVQAATVMFKPRDTAALRVVAVQV